MFISMLIDGALRRELIRGGLVTFTCPTDQNVVDLKEVFILLIIQHGWSEFFCKGGLFL